MATLSFESVGVLADVRQTLKPKEEQLSPIPIGVKTPLAYSPETFFEMNYSLGEQIADNLKNLIQTNFGDRVGIPHYGANLISLLSEFRGLDEFNSEAMARIKTACSIWMPYVELRGYDALPTFLNGKFMMEVKLMITYRIPQIPSLASRDLLIEVELRAH